MHRWLIALSFLLGGVIHSNLALAETIRVSAAVSMRESLQEIALAYQAESNDEVLFTFGSSGQLATQIKNGADVDIFISAATKQVDDLAGQKLVDVSTQMVVARNSLVLIVPAASHQAPESFEALADEKYGRVAIGDPKTVPAGDYAMQVLTSLKLADRLANRLVYGTHVRQVLTYVEKNEVAAGIVYATDAKESGDKVRIAATADPRNHKPIVYPAVRVSSSRHPQQAARFMAYLGGDRAKRILVSKGFVVDGLLTP